MTKGMKNCRPAKAYAGGGKVEKTEKMPSGAQQWVRGKSRIDKMDTILGAERSRDATSAKNGVKPLLAMSRAVRDESDQFYRERGDKRRR